MDAYEPFDRVCQSLQLPDADRFDILNEASEIISDISCYIPNPNHIGNLKCLRPLFFINNQGIRAKTIRLMSLMTRFPSDVEAIISLGIDGLLARSLDRDSIYANERSLILRLIVKILTIGVAVPKSLLMSLVSMCIFSKEDPEQFTHVCLEALRSVLLTRPSDAIACNAMRVIVEAILEPKCTPAICTSLVFVILRLIDSPKTRCLIRKSVDLQPLFAVFTRCGVAKNYDPAPDAVVARGALVLMLRSWIGLFYLADDPLGLRSVINMLTLPDYIAESALARELVFDLIFDVFNEIRITSNWNNRRNKFQSCNLLCNYLAMVVMCLVNCGLLDALLYLGVNSNKTHSMQATSLLSAILNISATLLPVSYNTKLNELTSVVASALADQTKQMQPHSHVRARDMLTDLQMFVDSSSAPCHNSDRFYNFIATRGVSSRNTNKANFEDLAIRSECNGAHYRAEILCSIREASLYDVIDEDAIFMMLKDTRVMDTAQDNHAEWEIDAVLAIMQGPLLKHPSNIMTVLNKTKFLPRLARFLHPLKGNLTTMPWDLDHIQYMRLACCVTRVLCACGLESASLLTACVEQLAEMLRSRCFSTNPKISHSSLFSRTGVQCGAGRVYLIMIGIMSESTQGMRLLEKTGMQDLLEAVALNPALDYITRVIACHLDYSKHLHSRTILDFWLDYGSLNLRRYLIQQMHVLMRLEVHLFDEWGLPVLVKHVLHWSDLAAEVSYILEQACEDPGYLSTICKLLKNWKIPKGTFPFVDRLMLRLIGDEIGFKIAEDNNWTVNHLEKWESTESELYVTELETALMAALNFDRMEISPRFKRSTSDSEWYLERLHDTPFFLELSILSASTKERKLETDCFFELIPCPQKGTVRGRVACYILNDHGLPSRFVIADSNITIQAVLHMGKQSLCGLIPKFWYNRSCPSAVLQNAVRNGKDRPSPVDIADGTATWRFSFRPSLALEAVFFSVDIDAVGGPFPVCPAPHLFGQLTRTEMGCKAIESYLYRHIRNVLQDELEEIPVSLWNLAFSGSSAFGFDLLKDISVRCHRICIISYIAEKAARHPVLSIRATCYYILGIWSLHSNGRTLLSSLGWDFPQDPSMGIAVPAELESFLSLPDEKPQVPLIDPLNAFTTSESNSDPVADILSHITKLTNHVTRRSSQEALISMYSSSSYRSYFRSPAMYRIVSHLMSHYNFQVSMRRFVHFSLFSVVNGNLDSFNGDHSSSSVNLESLMSQTRADVENSLQRNRQVNMINNESV